MKSPAAGGFTLLELMATVAILGILLGIGVPAFREILTANRMTSVANSMVTAFTLARGEAQKRGIPVTLCAANAEQDACADTAAWNDGWLVFTDDIGDAGEIDDGDEILQVFPAPPGGFSIDAVTPADLRYVSFQRSGKTGTSERKLKISRPHCSGNKERTISISSMGRVGSAQASC